MKRNILMSMLVMVALTFTLAACDQNGTGIEQHESAEAFGLAKGSQAVLKLSYSIPDTDLNSDYIFHGPAETAGLMASQIQGAIDVNAVKLGYNVEYTLTINGQEYASLNKTDGETMKGFFGAIDSISLKRARLNGFIPVELNRRGSIFADGTVALGKSAAEDEYCDCSTCTPWGSGYPESGSYLHVRPPYVPELCEGTACLWETCSEQGYGE